MQRKIDFSRIKSSVSNTSNLNTSEVRMRFLQYGSNNILEKPSNAWVELIKNTALDPMIWFLIGTSFLFAILKDYQQTTILLLATIPLIGMDAFLHWRTQLSRGI